MCDRRLNQVCLQDSEKRFSCAGSARPSRRETAVGVDYHFSSLTRKVTRLVVSVRLPVSTLAFQPTEL